MTPPVPPHESAPGSPEPPLPAEAERWMREALAEARRGLGRTHPNPCVGAVVVRGQRILGRGHHVQAGAPHAEIVALAEAGEAAAGADLYSTLEPCDHWGRTPPCSRAILDAGVTRVISASEDPNPLVNGKGIARLRAGGVAVFTGLLKDEADALNRPFLKAMRTGFPWVTLKAAVTLDGKLATASGDSKWVTGEEARAEVHRLRSLVDAVVVGGETARLDDPQLTARLPGGGGRNPLRLVLDTRAELPTSLRLFHQADPDRTVIVAGQGMDGERARAVEATGARLWMVPASRQGVELEAVLRRLVNEGALHVLVEGGARLFASLLAARLADELVLFLAPKLLGADARSWVGALPIERLGDAVALSIDEVSPIGSDWKLRARFLWR
jgi:diaminohydroxyphosphoribosylaminopyrimidine deaminase / 5-amino-6-(5-phosphoribosylamino)uracil reductase